MWTIKGCHHKAVRFVLVTNKFETTFFELLLQPYLPVNHFHQCPFVRGGILELIYDRWLSAAK